MVTECEVIHIPCKSSQEISNKSTELNDQMYKMTCPVAVSQPFPHHPIQLPSGPHGKNGSYAAEICLQNDNLINWVLVCLPCPQYSARPTNCELKEFLICCHNIPYNIDCK